MQSTSILEELTKKVFFPNNTNSNFEKGKNKNFQILFCFFSGQVTKATVTWTQADLGRRKIAKEKKTNKQTNKQTERTKEKKRKEQRMKHQVRD